MTIRVALFFAVFLPAAALAQENCRGRLVECQQYTGNPMACFSLFAVCTGKVKPDSDETGLSVEISTVSDQGRAYARAVVTNATKKARTVGIIARQIRCADGSTERALFSVQAAIAPSATIKPEPVMVCYGQASAYLPDGSTMVKSGPDRGPAGPETGQQASPSLVLQCGSDANRTVQIWRLPHEAMRYWSWNGASGSINPAGKSDREIVKLLCAEWTSASPGFVSTLKTWLREGIGPGLGEGETPVVPNKRRTVIGVRG